MSDFVEGSVESDRGAGALEPAGDSGERSRGGRLRGWRWAVVGIVLLGVLGASAVAIAANRPRLSRLAARLAALDPGALLNGNTIVVRGAGARVYGVRDRPNFIAALGPHETIIGGKRDDNLAALGDGVTIIGGGGNDRLYGGRGATLIGGGGRDLLTDRGANATIRAGSGDVVIAAGRHDRVLCARGSRHVTIYAEKGEEVSPTCRAGGGRVLSPSSLRAAAPTANPSVIKGDGSNDNPFVAPCNDPGNTDCTISVFPARALGPHGWAHESVPAYKCPDDHPYLYDHNYGGTFDLWGLGVEVWREEDDGWGWPVAVELDSFSSYYVQPTLSDIRSGTLTGLGNSSAILWAWGGTWRYHITLHCTSDYCQSVDSFGNEPQHGCPGGAADRPRQAGSAHAPGLVPVAHAASLTGAETSSRGVGTAPPRAASVLAPP